MRVCVHVFRKHQMKVHARGAVGAVGEAAHSSHGLMGEYGAHSLTHKRARARWRKHHFDASRARAYAHPHRRIIRLFRDRERKRWRQTPWQRFQAVFSRCSSGCCFITSRRRRVVSAHAETKIFATPRQQTYAHCVRPPLKPALSWKIISYVSKVELDSMQFMFEHITTSTSIQKNTKPTTIHARSL